MDAYNQFLPQKGITSLVISLAELVYMDSSALGMLLILNDRAQAEEKKIELHRANSTIKEILDMTTLGNYFQYVERRITMNRFSLNIRPV